MAFLLLFLVYCSCINEITAGVWDLDSIEACEQAARAKGFDTLISGSKYLMYGTNKVWNHPPLRDGKSVNANTYGTMYLCMDVKLNGLVTYRKEDWKTLLTYANHWVSSPKHDQYRKVASKIEKDNVFFESGYVAFMTAMRYDYLPGHNPHNRIGTINLHDLTKETYIVYKYDPPIMNLPNRYRDFVALRVCTAQLPSKGVTNHLIASIGTGAYEPGYFVNTTSYAPAVVCSYPDGSKCFKMSLEEQTADHKTTYELTTAFRGTWFITHKPVIWDDGVRLCKSIGAVMLGSTKDTRTIHHLPWTKGHSFRWDLNRLWDALLKTYETVLPNILPSIGFHGSRDIEYVFDYNLTQGPRDNPVATVVYGVDPQIVTRERNYNGLSKKNPSDLGVEKFALCYKAYECVDPEIERKKRDVAKFRRPLFRNRCSRRRWMRKMLAHRSH